MDNSTLINDFIEQIWNNQNFSKLENFIHPDFKDHSLPPSLSPDKEGLKKWILGTSNSFEHKTVIEERVNERNKMVVKIRMYMKHIGPWRDIERTGLEVETVGYRLFKIQDHKIIEHWALIDGQVLENQLRGASHSCKIPE